MRQLWHNKLKWHYRSTGSRLLTTESSSPVKGLKLHWQHSLGLDYRVGEGYRLQSSLNSLQWSCYQAFQNLLDIDPLVRLINADHGGWRFDHLRIRRFRQALLGLLNLWGQRGYKLTHDARSSHPVMQVRTIKDLGYLLISNSWVCVGHRTFQMKAFWQHAWKCWLCFCRRYKEKAVWGWNRIFFLGQHLPNT